MQRLNRARLLATVSSQRAARRFGGTKPESSPPNGAPATTVTMGKRRTARDRPCIQRPGKRTHIPPALQRDQRKSSLEVASRYAPTLAEGICLEPPRDLAGRARAQTRSTPIPSSATPAVRSRAPPPPLAQSRVR